MSIITIILLKATILSPLTALILPCKGKLTITHLLMYVPAILFKSFLRGTYYGVYNLEVSLLFIAHRITLAACLLIHPHCPHPQCCRHHLRDHYWHCCCHQPVPSVAADQNHCTQFIFAVVVAVLRLRLQLLALAVHEGNSDPGGNSGRPVLYWLGDPVPL